MDDRWTQQLVDRVERLEKTCLRWRILAVAASLAVLLLVGILWTRIGQVARSLDVQPQHGSAIAFRNTKSQSGVLLGADPTGIGGLAFMDRTGQRLLEMGVNPDGSARLTVRSTDGKKLFEVP